MKKGRAGEDSSIRTFIRGLYKGIGFWSGKLKTRFLEMGIRNDSWGIVVYKNGIITEVTA